jgi:hypothetical protein
MKSIFFIWLCCIILYHKQNDITLLTLKWADDFVAKKPQRKLHFAFLRLIIYIRQSGFPIRIHSASFSISILRKLKSLTIGIVNWSETNYFDSQSVSFTGTMNKMKRFSFGFNLMLSRTVFRCDKTHKAIHAWLFFFLTSCTIIKTNSIKISPKKK